MIILMKQTEDMFKSQNIEFASTTDTKNKLQNQALNSPFQASQRESPVSLCCSAGCFTCPGHCCQHPYSHPSTIQTTKRPNSETIPSRSLPIGPSQDPTIKRQSHQIAKLKSRLDHQNTIHKDLLNQLSLANTSTIKQSADIDGIIKHYTMIIDRLHVDIDRYRHVNNDLIVNIRRLNDKIIDMTTIVKRIDSSRLMVDFSYCSMLKRMRLKLRNCIEMLIC